MGERAQLYYGAVPVPYTVSWSDEANHHLDVCPHSNGRMAISQAFKRSGVPEFSNPHFNRQREIISTGRCDLCAKSLSAATKVSLSKARPSAIGAEYGDILQVEPLLHRRCAATSVRYCPSLKRDIQSGTLFVRQVLRWRCQLAIISETGVAEITKQNTKAVGYAKVQLLKWIDRDLDWLTPKDKDQ